MKKLFNHRKNGNRMFKLEMKNSKLADWDSWLCDDCKSIGYCKLRYPEPVINTNKFDIKEYLDWIPLRADSHYEKNSLNPYLQIAYDAFHQEDYETAVLNFRTLIERYGYFGRMYKFSALCYFLIKDYEAAAQCMDNVNELYISDREQEMISRFTDEIARLLQHQAAAPTLTTFPKAVESPKSLVPQYDKRNIVMQE